MNFITMAATTEERVELKYCERCGGLFLRKPGTLSAYCPGCVLRMSAEPSLGDVVAPGRRLGRPARVFRGRKPRTNGHLGKAQISSLHAVAVTEAAL